MKEQLTLVSIGQIHTVGSVETRAVDAPQTGLAQPPGEVGWTGAVEVVPGDLARSVI